MNAAATASFAAFLTYDLHTARMCAYARMHARTHLSLSISTLRQTRTAKSFSRAGRGTRGTIRAIEREGCEVDRCLLALQPCGQEGRGGGKGDLGASVGFCVVNTLCWRK